MARPPTVAPPPAKSREALLRALRTPSPRHEPDWQSLIPLVQGSANLAATTFSDPMQHRLLSPLVAAALHHRTDYVALLLARAGCAHDLPLTPALLAAAAAPPRAAPEPSAARTIALLAAAGADAAARCSDDGCPLDALGHAVASRSVHRVRALLKAGARAGARYRDGTTPLHVAARTGCAEVALALVEAGGAADILDCELPPRTPADVALVEGHLELGEWLDGLHRGQTYTFVRQ